MRPPGDTDSMIVLNCSLIGVQTNAADPVGPLLVHRDPDEVYEESLTFTWLAPAQYVRDAELVESWFERWDAIVDSVLSGSGSVAAQAASGTLTSDDATSLSRELEILSELIRHDAEVCALLQVPEADGIESLVRHKVFDERPAVLEVLDAFLPRRSILDVLGL